MGTPNKLTPEVREQALAALRAGADLGMAARAVGVHRAALEKAMQRSDDFRSAVNAARDFADELIVKRLFDKAREGDTTAMIFWLKNRQPSIWRDRHDYAIEPGSIARRIFQLALPGTDHLLPASATGVSSDNGVEHGEGRCDG